MLAVDTRCVVEVDRVEVDQHKCGRWMLNSCMIATDRRCVATGGRRECHIWQRRTVGDQALTDLLASSCYFNARCRPPNHYWFTSVKIGRGCQMAP